ncbi:MAG: GDP-mannose 4,6-dehydratase [Chloroflexi bacterium]|nr:GDP-mannose 4,6-dehydratase [Chloroflexota bacterium]
MRILITGVGGFAGSHLADALLAQGERDLCGVLVAPGRPNYLDERVRLVVANLREPAEVAHLLAEFKPDRIYHLAGQAFVPQSWSDPWDTLENNIRAQLNILHGCVQLGLMQTRVLAVGSNEEYGRLDAAELPARETSPLRPDSPYGVSKIAQDYLGQSYFISHGLPVVRVRPFNHIGPRQSARFVAADFAGQIVEIERGRRAPVVRVGNLQAERDFSDVRDIVRGYVAALEQGQAGEVYNVASGVPRPISVLLDGLLALAQRAITVEVDPAKLRPSDTSRQQGDSSKLRAATGWEPRIPFEQTLKDILDYERRYHS